ncbi:MAG TPA: polyprenyl synthetase family protein [Candidatus Nitrosotalea sp.]|nr:polyprenyl synthetase family protein [Candidatus Nitrosotalea sp.]
MVVAETKAVDVTAVTARNGEESRTWKQIVEPVNPFLDQVAHRLAEQVETFEPQIALYAQYALTNQGKQLRPALVALSAGTVGTANDSLVTVAVIIEMVHLATLVHDDVMDEAVIRRRRPTLAATWGNEISVLLGDCLFAHALQLAASFPTPEVCRAVAAATKTVCSGEILQTQGRNEFPLSRAEYFKVLEMKTAELFALSCTLGAGLCGASPVERGALRSYGLALGTAYQIYDDCLDVFGSEAAAGKSLGTDLANGKLTLPVLVALERGTVADRRRLKELIGHGQGGNVPAVVELLGRYESLEESRRVIHGFLGRARQSVSVLPESEDRLSLIRLAGFLAEQTDALGV